MTHPRFLNPPDPGPLREIADPTEQAKAAIQYIRDCEAAADETRSIRDEAVRRMFADLGVTEVVRRTGMSATAVKNIDPRPKPRRRQVPS